jgi:hypothetical protein
LPLCDLADLTSMVNNGGVMRHLHGASKKEVMERKQLSRNSPQRGRKHMTVRQLGVNFLPGVWHSSRRVGLRMSGTWESSQLLM